MEKEYEYTDNLHYPDEVLNAVRYGYQYRLEAEEVSEEDQTSIHYRLGDASDVVFWLANLIINGIAWDSFKLVVKKVVEQCRIEKRKLPQDAEKILNSQDEYWRLYEYVKEYRDGQMSISDKQSNYIWEEIVADYSAKESSKIISTEGRFPTMEESRRINSEAIKAADIVLSGRINANEKDVNSASCQ